MPVNANILAQFAQPVRSVNDYMADYERQDANKLAGQRNALLLKEAQGTMADRERARLESDQLRNALMGLGAGATDDQRINALKNTGLASGYAQADALQRSMLERRNIESQAAEREAKIKAEKYGLQRKQLEHGVQWLQVAQSPQQAAQMFTDGVQKGYWGMQDAQKQVATIPQDPAQFQQWKQQQLAQILDAEKQLPKLVAEDQGGTRLYGARNPFTGALTQNAAVPITQSANNAATVGASYANAAATREIAKATRDAASISANAKSETDIRKEFADLPEVKKYKNSIPAYQAIVKASQTNNPQADINLIYGLAKLYDPDSVVREGEYDTIANSQSIPEWLKGQAQRLAGGGKLTPATKSQILEQAQIRIDSYKSEVDGARQSYEQITKRRGLDPSNVFPAIGEQVTAPGGLSAAEKAELEQLRKQLGRK